MKYSDLTLEDAYECSYIFDLICDADKQEVQIGVNENFNKTMEMLSNIFKSVAETIGNAFIQVGQAFKDLGKKEGETND